VILPPLVFPAQAILSLLFLSHFFQFLLMPGWVLTLFVFCKIAEKA
jgi:hypothetical protein